MGNIAILKYIDQNGKVAVSGINSAARGTHKIRFGLSDQHHAWMNEWNVVFRCTEMHFLPNATWSAIQKSENSESLKTMLKSHTGVEGIVFWDYVILMRNFIIRKKDRHLVIHFTRFLCQSLSKKFISSGEIFLDCPTIPVVDRFGCINVSRAAVLVPASVSKWAMLMGSNPWTQRNYVELGEEYAKFFKLSGENSMKMLHDFIVMYVKPKDVPELYPPDPDFPIAASNFTKELAFLLLDWIRYLMPTHCLQTNKFFKSIGGGKWLKTCAGYNSPNQCLLSGKEEEFIFAEMGDFLSHIPIIDEQFYDGKIRSYESVLKYLGVKFGLVEAYPMIVKLLMSLAECKHLTKAAAIPLLKLMKYSMKRDILSDENLKVLKEELSLKTRFGYKAASDSILRDSKWGNLSEIADLPFIDDSYYGKGIYSFKDELAMMGVVVDFTKGSNLVIAGMKLPSAAAASKYAFSLLEQIRLLNSEENQVSFAADLIKEASNRPWLKTNIGFKLPTESFLSDPEWACMLHVLEVPIIDETFYRSRIGSFKMELQLLGVTVSFNDAKNTICSRFKVLSSSFKLSKRDILSLLSCLKHMKGMENSPANDFKNCLSEEKCLLTSHGYKHPTDSILFDSEWGPISEIAVLPFIDDAFYGKSIYSYRDELKMMGVVVDFRDGCRFVVESLKIPEEPVIVPAATAFSLLACIRILLAGASDSALPDDLLKRLKSKWIMTHMGYRTPERSFLFISKPSSSTINGWEGPLEPQDAPFIDENFYGTGISLYREELKVIGVKVEEGEGCSILADILKCHSNFSSIKRIYGYLDKFKWKPQSPANSNDWIFIPNQNGSDGEWVQPGVCVLSDVDNLFDGRLHVLQKYYGNSLLNFFSAAFGVAKSPSTPDYLKLWKNWESKSQHQITTHECCSFWKYICGIWYTSVGENIAKSITKLPAKSKNANSTVRLIDKNYLLIPDDLQLEQLFAEASTNPLFVWNPHSSTPGIVTRKLHQIYSSLCVRKLSESVHKGDDFCMDHRLLNVVPRNRLIGKGLLKLVLAFLADSFYCTSVRHRIAKHLLGLSVFETAGPIMLSYKLVLPQEKGHLRLSVKAHKMVFWEMTNNKLFIQTENKSGHEINLELACQFARVISECLLTGEVPNYHIDGLYKLIRLGYFLDFNLDSIECLLKMENLEIVTEDEVFISSAFVTDNSKIKREAESAQEMSPSPNTKRRRCSK